MLTYVLPTRDRPGRLKDTLHHLGQLPADAHDSIGGAEVIVVDNASSPPVELPSSLDNGMPLRVIRLHENLGAAARNIAVARAHGGWIFMLDDDSYPLNCDHVPLLVEMESDVAAVGAQIILPDGRREAGGLPEVIIGCGAAIRRQAFLDVGGYDPAFHYYAEEYDLCAKLIGAGWRIVHDFRMLVRHAKTNQGRDMNMILRRLVRNNGWISQRYAPDDERTDELARTVQRYAQIAVKEHAAQGFACGVAELLESLPHQTRQQLSREQFDRFTGASHISINGCEATTLAIVDRGKNDWAIVHAVRASNKHIASSERDGEALVIGTLSPGPMLDASERRVSRGCAKRVIVPWTPRGAVLSQSQERDAHLAVAV